MMKDAMPARIFCLDAPTAAEIEQVWPGAPKISLLENSFVAESRAPSPPIRHADSDLITIIYTSGTSGEPKGVVLNAGNINHMLGCTSARLDQLMGPAVNPDRIFHYLPFCFAGSWILMLSALARNSILTLSTDIAKLAEELKLAAPDYFLNVPTLLERVRAGIVKAMGERGGVAETIFTRSQKADVPFMRQTADFSLVSRGGYRAIRLNYQVPELGLVIVLPDDIEGAGAVARRLGANELAELFTALRERVAAQTPRLLQTAEVLATLDVLAGLAELAASRQYCRPEIVDAARLAATRRRSPPGHASSAGRPADR